MSAPFRDVDFLSGNWRPLEELARKTDAPFPATLPALSALDLDKLQDMRNKGLYGEVMHRRPSDFCAEIQQAGIASTVEEMKNRLSVSHRPTKRRPPLPTLNPKFGF